MTMPATDPIGDRPATTNLRNAVETLARAGFSITRPDIPMSRHWILAFTHPNGLVGRIVARTDDGEVAALVIDPWEYLPQRSASGVHASTILLLDLEQETR